MEKLKTIAAIVKFVDWLEVINKMNTELLEHELNLLEGKTVALVRPGFGTQSDSWIGLFSEVKENTYPIRFHVGEGAIATTFTVDDVIKITDFDGAVSFKKVIHLKGPHDYKETYEKQNS